MVVNLGYVWREFNFEIAPTSLVFITGEKTIYPSANFFFSALVAFCLDMLNI